MQIPEGAKQVTVVGGDLRKAVAAAAVELGIEPAQVDHKIDLSYFRSSLGVSVARTDVRVIAWDSGRTPPTEEELKAAEEKRKQDRAQRDEERSQARDRRDRGDRGDRRDRDRGERRDRRDRGDRGRDRDRGERKSRDRGGREDRRDRDERRGPEEGTTEASEFAQEWFKTLLGFMDVEGEVTGTGNEDRVHLAIKADRAGRIVGKRGATLRSIRQLLGAAVKNRFGDLVIDVDVGDDRRRERRSQDEERPRRKRSRDRGDRGRRRPSDSYSEEKLRLLARRAAEKSVESGQTITINLKLNSYDRRLVHLEIAEVDGVESRSEEREIDGEIMKYVQVIPLES